MDKIEILKELTKMQEELDRAIYSEHRCEFDIDNCYLAMADEIGELTHEIKAKWCWWKKQCPPIDQAKVLEELVDVWHFALSIYNHEDNRPSLSSEVRAFNGDVRKPRAYKKLIQIILSDYQKFILGLMIELSATLGFSLEDVYEAYVKKNKVNYERLKNGY